MKSYERAKKDHDKLVRNREKHLAKLEKARQQKEKEREKKEKEKEYAGLSQHEINERERLKKEAERMQKEKERMEGRSQEKPAEQATPAQNQHVEAEQVKRAATVNTDVYDAAMIRQQEEEDRKELKKNQKAAKKGKDPTKQKDRKFCALPPNDTKTGARDVTWIRVYMENMDEVVAHTSLFFVSETYAKLVGDTAERIEKWVRDAATIRAIKQAQDWE